MITVASCTDARQATYFMDLLQRAKIKAKLLKPAPSVFQIVVPEDQADVAGAIITSTGYMLCAARRHQKLGSVKDWRPDGGWERFLKWEGIYTWDVIVETGLGDPTEREIHDITSLGYYGERITEDTVQGLHDKISFRPPSEFRVRITHPDEPGMTEKYFKTKEALIVYAQERGGGDIEYSKPDQCSWINDVGSRVEVDGASCWEIFPDILPF